MMKNGLCWGLHWTTLVACCWYIWKEHNKRQACSLEVVDKFLTKDIDILFNWTNCKAVHQKVFEANVVEQWVKVTLKGVALNASTN